MTDAWIIKAQNGHTQREVVPFLATGRSPSQVSAAESPDNKAETVSAPTLLEQLAARDAEIARHEQALAAAFADGERAGRQAAEDEFQDSRAEALEALADGLREAGAELQAAFDSFDALALLVATEAVDNLMGDAAQYRSILKQAIEAQINQLRDATLLKIAVSRLDFPDTNEVVELEKSLGDSAQKLTVEDRLDAGQVHIKLVIGSVELGLKEQWSGLKQLLAGHANGCDVAA
jgi:flagellar biosynthesis/type III secretory pathway protein FliH